MRPLYNNKSQYSYMFEQLAMSSPPVKRPKIVYRYYNNMTLIQNMHAQIWSYLLIQGFPQLLPPLIVTAQAVRWQWWVIIVEGSLGSEVMTMFVGCPIRSSSWIIDCSDWSYFYFCQKVLWPKKIITMSLYLI